MIGALPEALIIDGVDYQIRTDHRNVLQLFEVFQDPNLTPEDMWIVAVYLMFKCFTCIDDVVIAARDGFNMKQLSRYNGLSPLALQKRKYWKNPHTAGNRTSR